MAGELLLTGATLIDGTGRPPRIDCAIVVRHGRIAAIRPAASARQAAPDLTVTDVEGRTVIPGLFNCHVHLQMDAGPAPLATLANAESEELATAGARRAHAMLRRGITTVRDCGARDSSVMALRDAIARGAMLGPRILACGRALGAVGGHAAVLSDHAAGEADIAAAARGRLKAGADFVKLMATGGFGKDGEQLDHCELTVEELRAAAQAAHAEGKKAAVHAYGNQGIRNALAAGADTIEHATFLDEETVALLKRRGTTIVPTLTNTFRVSTEGRTGGVADYIVRVATAVFPTMMATARLALRSGVRMALGTDAGSWLNPHDDLVTELKLRVEAGATTLEALLMATRDSAEALGLGADLGTLEPGKVADLVVLDGDPLADVGAVGRIARVFRAGVPVTP